MTALETALADFLPRQRWFAGKGRPVEGVRVEADERLVEGPPALRFVVAAVAYADGGVDRYALPLGEVFGKAAAGPAERGPGLVWSVEGGPRAYDAVHDPRLRAVLFDLVQEAASSDGLRCRRLGDRLDPALGRSSRLLGAEQSNTSIVYGERVILKLFRRLQAGDNPELEVTRALAAVGFAACAPPLGWIEGFGSTLGLLQPFYAGAVEGWQLAVERVTASYRGRDGADNFTGEARTLGETTADLHAKLAEALPTVTAGPPELARQHARLHGQLAQAAALVPEIAAQRAAIEAVFAQATQGGAGRRLQRVHGDFHLGQVLRVPEGSGEGAGGRWVVLDFEGEPARSLEERRRPASPLQDVAGMLRSFDYAAWQPLMLGGAPVHGAGPAQVGVQARAWVEACQAAYLDGYRGRATGVLRPGAGDEQLLRALELDKAVYEVLYEARHRPEWISIPLGGVTRLLGS